MRGGGGRGEERGEGERGKVGEVGERVVRMGVGMVGGRVKIGGLMGGGVGWRGRGRMGERGMGGGWGGG